jgi:FkbM family methyltransferase
VTTTVTNDDISFTVQPRTDRFWQMFETGAWEPWTLDVLRERLGSGSHHVDIGTWVGVTVLFAAALGATVNGFEPDPAALQELEANLAANPDLAKLVTIHPTALAATAGKRRLGRNQAGGDGMSSLARDSIEGIDVHVEAVAEWLDRRVFTCANLVKIDIEGGEYELLPAMRNYLDSSRPDLLLSLHAYHLFEGLPPSFTRRGPGRILRNRLLMLHERVKIAWLATLYPNIYVASEHGWHVVRKVTWLRLLHVPRNFEFFFSVTPFSVSGSAPPRPLKPWKLWF